MSDDIDKMIATFQAALRGTPDYAYKLAKLAAVASSKDRSVRALELAREAIAADGGDGRSIAASRRVLGRLIPGYHVPMMNDTRRNPAWDAALRRAIRPGMHVLEIGAGAGMLAMMAARADAERVITCETHPVAARLARELAARNGYADRITVIDKRSQDLVVGVDLERPADLLFCDIFGDSLFDFDPLAAIADARARLTARAARVVPASIGLRVALARWEHYGWQAHLDSACGFDLSPMADMARPYIRMSVDVDGLSLISEPRDIFHFNLADDPLPPNGANLVECVAAQDCEINGIASWIQLELDAETTLEPRPESGAQFFSSLIFCALRRPIWVRAGEELRVAARYEGKQLETWLERDFS